jgi:hypothetical protein
MQETGIHIIRSTKLDLTFAEGDGFRLQEQSANMWYNDLLPAIERELENYSYPGEVVQIPQLNIVINATNANNWREDILPQVINALREKINEQIPIVRVEDKNNHGIASASDKAVRLYKTTHFFTTFVNYLTSGLLPWGSSINTELDLKEQTLALVEQISTIQKEKLVTVLRENKAARLRFSMIFTSSPDLLPGIYKSLLPSSEIQVAKAWIESVDLLASKLSNREEVKQQASIALVELLFTTIGTNLRLASNEALLKLFTPIFKELQVPIAEIRKIKLPVSFAETTMLIEAGMKEENKSTPLTSKNQIEVQHENLSKAIEETAFPNRIETTITTSKNTIVEEAVAEGIFIANAGLVLAAPFFNTLFERTGLAKNYKILDIDRAVCLANYAVSGQTSMMEFELVLPKILCGVPLEQEINTSVYLSAAMQEQADDMLRSLIEYWTAIKNTTLEGLRESFLKREGKLNLKNTEWLLQVEQRSYDMLLQQLPWNYQWLKLPWMPAMLRVEWVS